MAAAGARDADAPHLYGFAIAGVAARRAHARVRGWWRHPRRRRLALVLGAVAASPVLLALAVAQTLLNRLGVDAVTPFVNRFYSHERLAAAGHPGAPLAPDPQPAAIPQAVAAGGPAPSGARPRLEP
jgi:hypothetical protein